MHHGVAVSRAGDYFGSVVNLAARISARASAREVLLSASTGFAAGAIAGVSYEARGRHELKGVSEPVELVAAVRAGSHGAALTVDPVCQMTVEPDNATGRLMFEGTAFFFCALGCAGAFARNPERYTRS